MAKNNLLVWLGAGLVIAIIAGWITVPAGISDIFSSSDGTDDLYPSDLKTTITLNTGDKLATTATQVTTDYYVFSSAGDFLKKGTTSSGTASFTVPSGGNYKLVAFYDSGTEYLPMEVSFSTNGDDATKRAIQSVNMDMIKSSAATINKVRNPIDLDTNVTCSASSSCHFDILISASTARAAIGSPVIVVDVNTTAIDDVTMAGLSDAVCPKRLTSGTGRVKYCFATGNDLDSTKGVVQFTGTLQASSTGPVSLQQINFTVIDEVMYAEADYQTQGYSALLYGTENPVGLTNIGAADSSVSTLTVD